MIIKLIPQQIPMFWEAIKYTVKMADEVDDKHIGSYSNELLHALLNEKAQCFVRLSNERVLEALLITRIMENKQTNERYLYAQALYSWQVKPMGQWAEDFEQVLKFARKAGCKYVHCQSRNPRMWEIYKNIGLSEDSRHYTVQI